MAAPSSSSHIPVHETQTDNGPSTGVSFRDVTQIAQIQFRHVAGGNPYFVPRSIGSGAALIDFDNDGLLDLYLIQNAGPNSKTPNRLFRQVSAWRFADVTADSGLDVTGWGMGAAVGDVNNDGRADLVVTEYGKARLFLNVTTSEQPNFIEVTESSGLTNTAWATSASFLDYDRDGWLDLVIANYLQYDPSRRCTDAGGRTDFCGPQSFAPVSARLFRNLGAQRNRLPQGGPGKANTAIDRPVCKFEDVSVNSGIALKPGAGLGVLCTDFNGDHWQDIFIANDGTANTLWINNHDGSFSEQGMQRGVAYNAVGEAEADMGVAWGDVDTNGLMDLFVTHRASESHTLWQQTGRGVFVDQTVRSAIAQAWRGTGFGTTLNDFDNDGDLDLAIVNGRVLRPPAARHHVDYPEQLNPFWRPYAEPDQILTNDGHGRFHDASAFNPEFSRPATVSRGLACGDLDNNGSLDLVVTSIASSVRVFRNTGGQDGNWLIIRAFDPEYQRDAYGATVEVALQDQTLRRCVNPGYSYLTSNDPRCHFGLGDVRSVNQIVVTWPDGTRERFPGGAANRVIQVNRRDGKIVSAGNDDF